MAECLSPDKIEILLTCEHGGNRIPPAFRSLFQDRRALLASHRGYDPGALEIARFLSKNLPAPLFYSTFSRLLVELNRSPGHPNLFSEITRNLPKEIKQSILQRYYRPYRQEVERAIAECIHNGRVVLHIGVHSFTPVWNGIPRNADVGILYDPQRIQEKEFALWWQNTLQSIQPALIVRRNYPYRGNSDGFTTSLRKQFQPHLYLGIELEINQKHLLGKNTESTFNKTHLLQSLKRIVDVV